MRKPDRTLYESTKIFYDEAIEKEYWKENGFLAEMMDLVGPLINIRDGAIHGQRSTKRFNIAIVVLTSINILLALVLNEINWTTWIVLVIALINNYAAHRVIKDAKDTEIDATKSIVLLHDLMDLRKDWLNNELGVIL